MAVATADTTENGALLRTILERPEDDAPRLVYADWLDEHGEPQYDPARAEFIRVQCELARLGPPHIVVTERCVLTSPYGPDYYSLTGGEETAGGGRLILEVKPGSRVDVMKPRGKDRQAMYGLRVHKITDDEVILAKDAKSRPWAGGALRKRERELLELPMEPQSAAFAWSQPIHSSGIAIGRPWQETFTFRRGFVAGVRLTLAAFYGGFCRQCGGDGLVDPTIGEDIQNCPICHGTRPGLAAALGATCPLEQVELTDREPACTRLPVGSTKERWSWFGPPHERDEARLPDELWRLVKVDYPTRDDALAALSAACCVYGRRLAGLEK